MSPTAKKPAESRDELRDLLRLVPLDKFIAIVSTSMTTDQARALIAAFKDNLK